VSDRKRHEVALELSTIRDRILRLEPHDAAVRHRVARIGRYVQQRELELGWIDEDWPHISRDAGLEIDVARERALKKRHHLPDLAAQVDRLRMERPLSGKCQELTYERVAARGGMLRGRHKFLRAFAPSRVVT